MIRTLPRRMKRSFLAAAVLLGPFLYAQAPSAAWRTVETPHFRVHYPDEYAEWALRAASRLESIRTEVAREIGFAPPQRIDVLVVNPIAEANGVAWPLLDTPRMVLYAEPPGPDEQLGAYGHWIDLLAVHETAHLAHMLRPSRNPLGRWIERLVLPLNPITLRAPRWVLEGYATVIEGRLTGAGRPTSTIRALILRKWAQSGRLPTYAQLNSDRRFLGMSMAYLAGSAFLEWLEQRAGEDALRNLWSRLTARERRSFDAAFTGVFGESPERLYGRFLAELTASAMAVARSGAMSEGALFQETPRASGDPAVSPDGTKLAVVIRELDEPEELVVWSTGEQDEELKKHEERIRKILERDPEDVAPVLVKPLPRKELHSLVMADGGDISTPRWMPDGKSILFAHRTPDSEGVLHFDLYRWDLERVTRLTRLADVRDADPLPDGRTAIAVRSRHGQSQLVMVDLSTGAVTPRTSASIDVVETSPRVSPDGRHVARVAHRQGGWMLLVDDQPVVLPGDPATPEWVSNEELVVTLFSRGFAELHRVRIDGTHRPVTRTSGGAFDATYGRDGRLFFMSLEPSGYVVRTIDANHVAPAVPELDPSLVPAIPPQPRTAATFTPAPPVAGPRPYGIGRQELGWFGSQNLAPDHRATELGVRLGDVVGRLNTLVMGSLGSRDGPDGAAIATAWRGWPVEVHAHAFTTDDDDGVELRGVWSRIHPLSRFTAEAGALSDDLLFGSVQYSLRQILGTTHLDEAVRVEVDDDSHVRAVAAASYRSDSWRVRLRYQIDRGDRVRIGGLSSSILPRSAYAREILDPALPVALAEGDDYDGWRIESSVPSLPVNAFYQRHELAPVSVSVAGLELRRSLEPNPILKTPGLDVTLGAAQVLDGELEGETRWWLNMRWRP